MEMRKWNWIKSLFLIAVFSVVAACDDNESAPNGKGEVQFEITDAPVDDANVEGVFVTIADIRVNGNSLQGFSKQTIDLKALSDGKTRVLGTGQFDARSYESVILVLDLESDETGTAPGCYVLDASGTKHQLKSTTTGKTEVAVNKSWNVVNEARTNLVLDFDLRKALRYAEGGYSFVSDNNLNSAVRLVVREKTGTIKGSYSESNDPDVDKIVVYAYKKGTFNAETETTPQGNDGLLFANAQSSAVVKQNLTGNEFTLAFLEEGEYELHFAGYTQETGTGRYLFAARLQSETTVDGSVAQIVTVKSGITIDVAASITGLL